MPGKARRLEPAEPIGMPGERIALEIGRPGKLVCCDCGLAHVLQVTGVEGESVTIGIWRDEDGTTVARGELTVDELEALRDVAREQLRKRRKER